MFMSFNFFSLEEWMKSGKVEKVIIGRDFNAWTRELEGKWSEENIRYVWVSNYKKLDKERKKLSFIE